jgi:hypothetical protein
VTGHSGEHGLDCNIKQISILMCIGNISRIDLCLSCTSFGEISKDIGNGSGTACGKMLEVIVNDFDLSLNTVIVRVDRSKGEYGCYIHESSDPDILRAVCI